METREIVHRMEQVFGKAVTAAADEGSFPHIMIEAGSLKAVLSYCAHDAAMRFDLLDCMTGVDTGQDLIVIYQLFSTVFSQRLNIKTSVHRHESAVCSATGFWRAAQAYEMEIAEMFGISFSGHPAPKKLLLPEDWPGYPLRKDYVFPEEYHAVEHRRAPLRKEHTRP